MWWVVRSPWATLWVRPVAVWSAAMVDELERRDLKRAMLSLCVGGGMGISTIIERV